MNILVTGASGQLGSQVIEFLSKSFKGTIIAGSRSVEKLSHLKEKGIEIRKVDFDDSATTDASFKGVDKLLIVSTDALAVPGLRLKQHLNAIASAKKNQVKHIVYTSLSSATDSPISFAPDHAGTEKALVDSGISYTILRNNWYFENLVQNLVPAKKSGTLMTATGEGKVGFVTREDCARTAAAVLASDQYKNQIIEVTNTEAVSYAQIAQELGVELVRISNDQLQLGLKDNDLPGFVVDLVATYEKAVETHKMSVTNNKIEEITGKKPVDLKQFLKSI